VWLFAPLGIIMCSAMMAWLPLDTWLRLVGWTIIGLGIFFAYGKWHAKEPRWSIKEHPAK
jgi:APA family basic amino acid/polyamine antiporter